MLLSSVFFVVSSCVFEVVLLRHGGGMCISRGMLSCISRGMLSCISRGMQSCISRGMQSFISRGMQSFIRSSLSLLTHTRGLSISCPQRLLHGKCVPVLLGTQVPSDHNLQAPTSYPSTFKCIATQMTLSASRNKADHVCTRGYAQGR